MKASRVSIGGFVIIVLGLIIVIVHALNLVNQFTVQATLSELGVILIGIAVQLMGLGAILLGRKQD